MVVAALAALLNASLIQPSPPPLPVSVQLDGGISVGASPWPKLSLTLTTEVRPALERVRIGYRFDKVETLLLDANGLSVNPEFTVKFVRGFGP